MHIRAFFLILAALLWAPVGTAQPPVADVRVLIDVSGSMRENDPDNLRGPALALLARLIPAGSRGGVWTFGTETRIQVPLGPVDAGWREMALGVADAIDSSEHYTDIPGALREAGRPGLSDARRSIILLTDGVVDVPGGKASSAAARHELLQELLPELRTAGFVLHTVALSDNADHELLERLAIDSGGLFAAAAEPEELERIFLAALDAAAPAEQLPLQGRRFLVDPSINEFTALVYRDGGKADTSLTGPDGTTHTAAEPGPGVRWLATTNYDLVTVSDPVAGEWQLATTPHPGSRITIVSDLNLAVAPIASSIFAGSDPVLTANLYSDGELLRNPDLLDLIDVRVDILREQDERSWRLSAAGNGREARYQTGMTMLSEPGGYRLRVIADGKTFRRQYQQRVEVMAPFRMTLSEAAESDAGGKFPVHTLQLFQLDPEWVEATVQPTARVRAPAGGMSKPLAAIGERRWRAGFDGWQEAGSYTLYVEVLGKDAGGASRRWRSQALTVEVGPQAPMELPLAPEPGLAPAAATAAEPATVAAIPESESESESEPGTPVWVWASALTAVNLVLMALLWFGWKKLRRSGIAPPTAGSDDEADDEDGGKDGAGERPAGADEPQERPAVPTPGAPDAVADPPDQSVDAADDLALDTVPDPDAELDAELRLLEEEARGMEIIGDRLKPAPKR